MEHFTYDELVRLRKLALLYTVVERRDRELIQNIIGKLTRMLEQM